MDKILFTVAGFCILPSLVSGYSFPSNRHTVLNLKTVPLKPNSGLRELSQYENGKYRKYDYQVLPLIRSVARINSEELPKIQRNDKTIYTEYIDLPEYRSGKTNRKHKKYHKTKELIAKLLNTEPKNIEYFDASLLNDDDSRLFSDRPRNQDLNDEDSRLFSDRPRNQGLNDEDSRLFSDRPRNLGFDEVSRLFTDKPRDQDTYPPYLMFYLFNNMSKVSKLKKKLNDDYNNLKYILRGIDEKKVNSMATQDDKLPVATPFRQHDKDLAKLMAKLKDYLNDSGKIYLTEPVHNKERDLNNLVNKVVTYNDETLLRSNPVHFNADELSHLRTILKAMRSEDVSHIDDVLVKPRNEFHFSDLVL